MPLENPLYYHDDVSDESIYKSMIKHYPPIVGEYAYFDSRCWSDMHSYTGIKLSKHFVIDIVPGRERSAFGCHFSSPQNRHFTKYVSNHGIITYVKSTS